MKETYLTTFLEQDDMWMPKIERLSGPVVEEDDHQIFGRQSSNEHRHVHFS